MKLTQLNRDEFFKVANENKIYYLETVPGNCGRFCPTSLYTDIEEARELKRPYTRYLNSKGHWVTKPGIVKVISKV